MTTGRQVTLITGASSGIGRSYALQLAKLGHRDLLLVARRKDRLEDVRREVGAIAGVGEVTLFAADLADESGVEALLSFIGQEGLQVDTLVNAAGFGTIGEFSRLDVEREKQMVALNCLTPMRLIRAVVGPMEQRGRGTIINICSIGAFQPAPYMAAYAASKSFLLSFTMGIGEELRDKGIHVFAHCPGPTTTEFARVAGLPENMSPIPAMTADQAVEEALAALSRGKRLLVNGFLNRWLVRLGRLASLERSARAAKGMLLSRWTPPEGEAGGRQ